MVDYRNEIEWAKKMKAAGVKVYFIGVFASFKSELFLSSRTSQNIYKTI